MDVKFFEELACFSRNDPQGGGKTSDMEDLSCFPCESSLVYLVPNVIPNDPTIAFPFCYSNLKHHIFQEGGLLKHKASKNLS